MIPVRKSLLTAVAVAALALSGAPRARAQMPPFPIPIGAEVVIGPMLLLIGAAALLTRDDQRTLRSLEDRGRWEDAARFATRRIAGLERATADDDKREQLAQWLIVRAQARRQQRSWAAAAEDLERASAISERAERDALAELAVCLGALQRPADAERALRRLAALDPGSPAPWRQLAMLRSIAGDGPGVDEALARLAELAPQAARSLERDWIRPSPGSPADLPLRDAPIVDPDIGLAAPPGVLAAERIALGAQSLALPPGRWLLASVHSRPVRGRRANQGSAEPDIAVDALAGTALALTGRTVRAALTLHANRRSDRGVTHWQADECREDGTLLSERFARRFDTPECLQVRLVDTRAPGAAADLRAAAGALDLAPMSSYFEVRYACHGIDRFVALTVWMSAVDDTGKAIDATLATDWGRSLAPSLRALVQGRSRIAQLPDGLP